MAEKLKCPHCGTAYEDCGLQFDCTHALTIKQDESGAVSVEADRGLSEGNYYCGYCGDELFSEDVGEIDSCLWD